MFYLALVLSCQDDLGQYNFEAQDIDNQHKQSNKEIDRAADKRMVKKND